MVGAIGGYRIAVLAGGDRSAAPTVVATVDSAAAADSVNEWAVKCSTEPIHLKNACYRELLDHRIGTSGVVGALNTLRTLTQADPDVERDVHMYAHGIGIDAYRRTPDINATFTHCTPEFSSGCYHGVLQAYFDAKGTADPAVVKGACSPYEVAADKRWLLFQCLHGMGHGLDMALDHDLPRALSACDLLVERWHRESCYGGAFMENIVHVTVPDHPATQLAAHDHSKTNGMAGMHMGESHFKAVDSTNLQYPCSIMAERYLRECYGIQTALVLAINRGSIPKTAQVCDQAPVAYRAECYESLGRDISAYANYDARTAVRLCTVGALALRRYCYRGAAASFVDNEAKAQPGFDVCTAVPKAEEKPTCFERVGELVMSLAPTPATRARMCALPSRADTRACRQGAQVSDTIPDNRT